MDFDPRAERSLLAARYSLVDRSISVGGRTWRITAVEEQDSLLEGVKTEADLETFPYGMMLWASALALAEELTERAEWLRSRRALELGAGAGLPGIVARALGADVTQTDHLAESLALCRINAGQNGITGIAYRLLDWRHRPPEERFDLVMGADILYERSLHAPLRRLLESMMKAGAVVIIADPGRDAAIDFMDGLERAGRRIRMKSRVIQWEGRPRETALFSLGDIE